MRRPILLLLAAVLLTAGCATSSRRLATLSLGMTEPEVTKAIGQPRAVRGAIRNKYGQAIQVWEYRLAMPSDDSVGTIAAKSVLTVFTLGMGASVFEHPRRDYWLYFMDDRLVRWGEAGDWDTEADRIYQIRFDAGQRITAP